MQGTEAMRAGRETSAREKRGLPLSGAKARRQCRVRVVLHHAETSAGRKSGEES
jgi:hypothetical protein